MSEKWVHKNEQCTMENVRWEKVRFDEFFDMLPTNTLSRDNLNNQRGEYQNIHYGDVLIKYPYCLDCNDNEIPYINNDVKFNTAKVKDGDVIFADTAEDDTVGKCVEVLNVGDKKIVSGLHTYLCRPKFKMAPGYLGYFLNSNHFHNQLLPYIAGSKVSSVNRTSIARTCISYPDDLSAQRRIAAILSSADRVIASTRKVIAKYKQMKQGLMEDLLKPKAGWKMVKLGDGLVDNICTGKLDANAMVEGGAYRFYTCAKDYSFIDNYAFDDEALLISGNGEYVGYVHYYKGRFNAYQRTYVLRGFSVDVNYLRCYLNMYLRDRIKKEMNAGSIPFIKMGTLTEMDICYPTSLSEQHRIAAILSGIDAKILAEEKVLEKYEKVKKGLMERLLEGDTF